MLGSGKKIVDHHARRRLLARRSIRKWSGLHNIRSSTGSILYIEDDQDTRELVTYVLAQENYKVVPADNYDDALLLARTNRFDLYLIDNWMTGGSGIDLCKKLREFNSRTPILFYSGAAYERDKQQAFAAGAQEYLVKPVENDELIATVTRVILEAKRTQLAMSAKGAFSKLGIQTKTSSPGLEVSAKN
jgi:DNA-binding response OmpR family regulator